jgi:hypothetical protein
VAIYPGAFQLHSAEEIRKNTEEVLFEQIVQGLIEPAPKAEAIAEEPEPKRVIFKGTFEEVTDFFGRRKWSDGLPIVPPTIKKVAEFLKYTDHPPDEILGIAPPTQREVTTWNIAVNGVMAGCRPEYMPLLIAIVEASLDPNHSPESLGSTGGDTGLIIVSGPIVKTLSLNSETGVLRIDAQANSSIGRFDRLYLRNLAGYLPGSGDMGCYGHPFNPVLAENMNVVTQIGWKPLRQTLEFLGVRREAANVVIIGNWGLPEQHGLLLGDSAEIVLNGIVKEIEKVDDVCAEPKPRELSGPERSQHCTPLIVISPFIAQTIAAAGYSRFDAQRYIFEHALRPYPNACKDVAEGKVWPAEVFCPDPAHPKGLLPRYHSPEEVLIVISGTPTRNRWFFCRSLCVQGAGIAKEIKLPSNWEGLAKK